MKDNYADVRNGIVVATRYLPDPKPGDIALGPDGKPVRMPYTEMDRPELGENQVYGAMDYEVFDNHVVGSWTVVGLTPEQIAQAKRTKSMEKLIRSDTGMIRVVEDIYAALVSKGLIAPADIPAVSRKKLEERAVWRGDL